MDPYIDLVEGGKDGEFFSEMNDYFYYAQIRRQGEVSTSPRRITRRIGECLFVVLWMLGLLSVCVHVVPLSCPHFEPRRHHISHVCLPPPHTAVHQIPDMMRALSFYPSEHDISHMQSELEYEMGEEVKEIDFETFLKCLFPLPSPVLCVNTHLWSSVFRFPSHSPATLPASLSLCVRV